MKKILFLCTGNSCSSQIDNARIRRLKTDIIEPYSAGVNPGTVDIKAVKVMEEAGIDISGGQSKHADSLNDIEFDFGVIMPMKPVRSLREKHGGCICDLMIRLR